MKKWTSVRETLLTAEERAEMDRLVELNLSARKKPKARKRLMAKLCNQAIREEWSS